MSLLGITTATVYPETEFTDSRGNPAKRPSETGVVVRCSITPVGGSRAAKAGTDRQTVSGGWVFMSRDAPLGRWSRVEWQGRSFSVSNGPFYVGPEGSAARHVEATLAEER